MNLQVLIDNENIFSMDTSKAILTGIALALLLFLAIKLIWRKLRSNENLKYEFITIIAHKFRTPLSQVKWTIENILEKERDPFQIENLNELDKSNTNLINLTGTLIELTDSDHTKLASYNFEKTNMCAMTNYAIEALKKNFHEKNLFFGIECSEAEIYASVDRARMEFVLQTILENSIMYSPPGRNIDVSISNNRNKVFIEITDNGIGISPSDIRHIFTKFYRTEKAQTMDTEGFGVGLYLARTIIKRHHGKIRVFSAGVDKGTTFIITLPLVR